MAGPGKAHPERVRLPVMLQSWDSISFFHWAYDPAAIRELVPTGLELDTWDGRAWVGLTPFVARVRPPAGPGEMVFPETNVRTYVRGPDGEPGVWFFSLDAARYIAVVGARAFYRLPYRWARMQVVREGSCVHYRSARRAEQGRTDLAVEIGQQFREGELGPLDHFLTARFRLYTRFRRGLGYAQVEHRPWPLRKARLIRLSQDLFEAAGLPAPEGEPLLHYSDGVDVRVGPPRRLQVP